MDQVDRLSIFNHPGRPVGQQSFRRRLSDADYNAAEFYVLMNCDEVAPYVE
ncbi:TdcA1-ORF2 protein [Corchorus olitorius]|nr:TdcA1-ORF2 protein [Corchorus olitorius]OMP03573.1 TdcA1-ORF2 protein [Corchorus olitorius]